MRGIGGIRLERRLKGMLKHRVGRQVRTRRGAALSVAVAVVLFVLYALVLGRGAAWLDGGSLRGLTASQRASEIDTMRGYLIQIGAGVLAAGALLYTALNFQLAREGHVTERYTKAIEQLGSDRLDVRLGAIYALERIMIDSDRDHPTIVEVLAAFVREHSKARALGSIPIGGNHPATDVQAAVTVLGRRPTHQADRLNLAGADLTSADLPFANLSRANMSGIVLAGAELTAANLTRSGLIGADLSGADLTTADLTFASLERANLSRGFMVSMQLSGANLPDANLAGAELSGAYLRGANLEGANLEGAKLIGADMTHAYLIRAKLTGADLTGADLTEARLTDADLSGADLTGVSLTVEQRSAVRGIPASSQEQQPQP